MKYDMFVFAGQSNMMGACALPPKHGLKIKKAWNINISLSTLAREGAFFRRSDMTAESFCIRTFP